MDENKNLNNQPEKEEEKKKKKCGFLVWWNKLSKRAKIGISAGAGVVLTSAIVFPTLAATVWNKEQAKKVTKETWVSKAVELVDGFCNATTKYTESQLKVKNNGVERGISNFEYSGTGTERVLKFYIDSETHDYFWAASKDYYGKAEKYSTLRPETVEGVTYEVHSNYIRYCDMGADVLKELIINKHGYVSTIASLDRRVEITYSGDPK